MIQRLLTTGLLLLTACAVADSEDQTTALKGVYAEIETAREAKAIQTLRNGSERQQEQMAEKIVEQPERYAPVVFFHLANYFFEQDDRNKAIFWLYAARIRTHYDIKRCTDRSVGDAVEVLNRQLLDLLRLIQFEDLENARRLMKQAVAWDRKTPHEYDARWIALHGLGPSLPTPEEGAARSLTVPRSEWKGLAEQHRKEYLQAFLEDTKALTPEQLEQIQAKIAELESASDKD